MNCSEQSEVGENVIRPGEDQVGSRPVTQPSTLPTESPLLPFPNLSFSFYSLLFLSSAPYNQVKAGERSCWAHIWARKGPCRGEAVSGSQGEPPLALHMPCFGTRLTRNFLFPFHRMPQADGAPNLPDVFPEGGRNTSQGMRMDIPFTR